MKKLTIIIAAVTLLFAACGTVQSLIKSSFPYTATLTIPASSATGNALTATSIGNSFDQNFSKDGNNSSRTQNARVTSAKLTAVLPADFNIGNLVSANVYMAKANGDAEVLVASRTDIGTDAGNNIVLDIHNDHVLDELIRQPNVRIRMVYKLRNKITTDASLRVSLGITADPIRK